MIVTDSLNDLQRPRRPSHIPLRVNHSESWGAPHYHMEIRPCLAGPNHAPQTWLMGNFATRRTHPWSGWWWLEHVLFFRGVGISPINHSEIELIFHNILGDLHHPNWRTPSFFRGVGWNHQPVMVHKKKNRFLLMSWSCSLNQSIEYRGLPRKARKAHLRGAETWAFLMEASSVSEHHFLSFFFIYFLRGHDINTYKHTEPGKKTVGFQVFTTGFWPCSAYLPHGPGGDYHPAALGDATSPDWRLGALNIPSPHRICWFVPISGPISDWIV